MISLDWKERLKLDTVDFVSRKLPQGDYDIDIVYNAYPKRVDNNIPSEVIVFVGKTLAGKLTKKFEEYIGFYDYLWDKKGENGRLIFAYVMKSATRRKPDLFLEYLLKKMKGCRNYTDINLVLNKAVFPLLKKDGKKYIDLVYNWLEMDNSELHKAIIGLFIKAAKNDPSLLGYIFHKMTGQWLNPKSYTVRDSIQFLKASYKIDPNFYFSVYDDFKKSRTPIFVDILCHAVIPVKEPEAAKMIYDCLNNWTKSGNVRIKKAAASGLKLLKKK
jgi:hypothetical protein